MTLLDRIRRASFWPMLRKEFIEMRRDRFTLAMLIGIPAIQLVLFGYAVQTDVRNVPTVVLDESRTSQSRRLIDMMANTRNFAIVGTAANRDEVREAIERGTLEQLVVTPIGKTSLMLGKTIPFAVVGYLQVTVILLLGKLLFDVPMRGSLLLLYLLIAPFIIASLGMGLFISAVTRTQIQAMQLSFFFIMPNILLSGFIFPRSAMPEPAQWVGAALPLTYFLTVMRSVLLKGVEFGDVWREALVLMGFAVLLVGMSVRKFSKTVE
jgi:ABC-type multidrug transport system permease subunit